MQRYLEPAADLALTGALILLAPGIAARLAEPQPANILLIGGAYLALVLGAMLLRRVRPEPEAKPVWGWSHAESRGCAAFLSLGYSSFMLAAMLISGGLLATDQPLAEMFDEWHALSPGLAMAFSVALFPAFFALPLALGTSPARLLEGTKRGALLLRAAGLLAVNFATLMAAAWWESYFAGAGPLNMNPFVKLGVILVLAILLALLWGPPRMVALAWNPGRLGLAGFCLALLTAAWRIVW